LTPWKGTLSVEDWAEIRRFYRAEGLSIKVIARLLGISKNAVKAAPAPAVPPKYRRLLRGSIADVVEPRIRGLLQAYPRIPGTMIAERIGWTRLIRVPSAHGGRAAAGASARRIHSRSGDVVRNSAYSGGDGSRALCPGKSRSAVSEANLGGLP
jgi:hypothetical protein